MDRAWEKVREFHQRFGAPVEDEPKCLPKDRRQFRSRLLMEEIQEFQAAETIEEQADAMIDTIYLALGTLVEMGIRPEKLFNIVHQANMQKLWADGKPRYEKNGKVMKPPSWKNPEPLLYQEIMRQKGK